MTASVLIIDFGSQVTQLIARRIREAGVYCEIHPFQSADAAFAKMKPQAVILSGGPASVTEFESPRGHFRFDPKSHNVIQPFIYIREVKEVGGGLNNVPFDKVANVADPGTGCTLPA